MRYILKRLHTFNGEELKDQETIYNIKQLIDGEYITGRVLVDGNTAMVTQLEYKDKGYELLTHITNESVWDEVQRRVEYNNMDVDNVPIDIIKWLSQEIMKEMFG